jgi:hypothetical protein
MPSYNAPAELHRFEMTNIHLGAKLNPGPRFLRSTTMVDGVKTVMAKRQADRQIYSITTSLEAGFGKQVLTYQDIEAISQRADFPRA